MSRADSDSVNLGSNPGSPATINTAFIGILMGFLASDKPEKSDKPRTDGRTEVGTAFNAPDIEEE